MKKLWNYYKAHPHTCFAEFIISVAVFGIICAIIAHYGLHGFDWKWFVFFDCPLYAFVIWAFIGVFRMVKSIFEMENRNNEKK